MKKNNFIKNLTINNILIYLILAFFSFFFNFWVSNNGVSPIDTFLHYDSGYKILKGELPVRDYWVIHGITLDYIQSIFFYLFGTNWISYISHSSLFNCILTLLIFNFIKNLKIDILYAFILAICFSILAYPISGVPFIDHHSTFFSIIAFLFFYYAFQGSNDNYFLFIPLIFALAFLSKPVPAAYFLILFFSLIIIYVYYIKNYKIFYKLFLGIFLTLLFLIFFLKAQDISLKLFLDQLIFYPISIGNQRFDVLISAFENRIFNFKFLIIPLLFLFYLFLKNKNYLKFSNRDFSIFFVITIFNIIMIFHQLLTKNQNFIFFLIPINVALIIYLLNKINFKYEKFLNFLFLVFTIALTFKYNQRFNYERKFHDLQNVNLGNYSKATEIDKTLYPLKWQSNVFSNSKEEIKLINNLISIINKSENNILLISNYNFLDAIIKKKLYLIVKNYDNVTIPPKKNQYFSKFKNYFNKKIIDKEISEIIIFIPNRDFNKEIKSNFNDLLGKDCFKLKSFDPAINSLRLKDC